MSDDGVRSSDRRVANLLLAPSPNWYGAHVSHLCRGRLAYCAQRSIVVLDAKADLRVLQVLTGHSSRTSCITHAELDNGELMLVTATQDRCVLSWRYSESLGSFQRHRLLSKRPAEVRAVSCGGSGLVVLGDVRGNLFRWRVGAMGSKIERLGSRFGSAIVSLACFPGDESRDAGVVAVGCADGSVALAFCGDSGDGEALSPTVDKSEDTGYESMKRSNPTVLVREGDGTTSVHCVVCTRVSDDTFWLAASWACGAILVHEVKLEKHGRVDVGRLIARLDALEPTGNGRDTTGNGKDKVHGTKYWGSLEWGECGKDRCLFSGSFGGRIVAWWDLKAGDDGELGPMHAGDRHARSPQCAALPESHSRAVFRLSAEKISRLSLRLTSVGLDRLCTAYEVSCSASGEESGSWHAAKAATSLGLGSHPLCLAVFPESARIKSSQGLDIDGVRVACGCGDSTIRVATCDLSAGSLFDEERMQMWRGIPAAVLALSWHPIKKQILAFGCEDGTVGMVDVKSKKMHLGISRHPSPVAALIWMDNEVQSWCVSGVVMVWSAMCFDQDGAVNSQNSSRVLEPQSTMAVESDGTVTGVWPGVQGRSALVGYSVGRLEEIGIVENDIRVLQVYHIDDELASGVRMVSAEERGVIVALTDTGLVAMFDKEGCNRMMMSHTLDIFRVDSQKEGNESHSSSLETPTCVYALPMPRSDAPSVRVAMGFESGSIGVFNFDIETNIITAYTAIDGHSSPITSIVGWKTWLLTSSQDQTVRMWDSTDGSQWKRTVHAKPGNAGGAADLDKVHVHHAGKKSCGINTDATFKISQPKFKEMGSGTTLTSLLPGTLFPADDTEAGSILELNNIADFLESSADSFASRAKANRQKDPQLSKALSQRAAALDLWQGDVGKALHTLVENDSLTSDFVAFAAGAGRDAWIAAARAYADYLERKGDVHLAALYRTQTGDAVDACLTYDRHKMLREAAVLAQSQLPADHPVAIRALERYGTLLAKTGNGPASRAVLAKVESPTSNSIFRP
jgi:WD40 repeat protein